MKRLKRKLKRLKKFPRFIYFLMMILYIPCYAFFAYKVISLSSIETVLRFVGLIALLAYYLFYLYKGLLRLLEKKYKRVVLLGFITLIISGVMAFGGYVIGSATNIVSGLGEKDKILYTSYLIAMNDTEITDDSVLGMISDTDDIEGYKLANEIIDDNNLKQDIESYDDYLEMLHDLYDGKIQGAFVSSNYKTIFGTEDEFTNIGEETKIVYKKSKEYDNDDSDLKSDKSLDEPFTVLVLGVDSEVDGLNANAAFNGDTLILATFNPDTLTATLFSIPRDTYVPIACRGGAQAKINSSAAYGTSCVIDTIEDLTGITIDYYAKINFHGVVDLVDAVGGVDVDVEEPDFDYNDGTDCKGMVCEQNSNREWGANTVYVPVGLNTLNGEQALAYSRCRHLYLTSDLARNQHQQDVITAIGKKIIKVKSYKDFKNILDAVINNVSTNMSTSQILSAYNILKDMIKSNMNDGDFVNIQRTYLETYSLPVYMGNGYTASALGYYQDSMDDITKAMRINLGLEEEEIQKTFSFDINEEYSGYVAGKGISSGTTNGVLSSFVGSGKSAAQEYCNEKGLSCSFTYVDENSEYYDSSLGEDVIAAQDPHANTVMKNVSSVTFYINGASVSSSTTSSSTSAASSNSTSNNKSTTNNSSTNDDDKEEKTNTNTDVDDNDTEENDSSSNNEEN